MLPSTIASQALSYNEHIKIDKIISISQTFMRKGSNWVGRLFQESQKLKSLNELKQEYSFMGMEDFIYAVITNNS